MWLRLVKSVNGEWRHLHTVDLIDMIGKNVVEDLDHVLVLEGVVEINIILNHHVEIVHHQAV